MNSAKFALSLVVSLYILSAPLIPVAAADDFLSPLLSPIFNGICNHVGCGQGNCKTSTNSTFGYECECKSGWSQLHIGSINYTCSNHSIAPAPAPSQDNRNISLFNPCSWSYCGAGTCVKTSDMGGHKCECNEGSSNLLNVTTLPCYESCSIGGNCANLGITPLNSSALSPPAPNSQSDNSSSSDAGLFGTNNLQMLLILVPFLLMIYVE